LTAAVVAAAVWVLAAAGAVLGVVLAVLEWVSGRPR
jgi:hypothetical protein